MKIEKLPSGSYRVRKTYKGKTYTVIFDTKPTQKEILKAISEKMDAPAEPRQRRTFKAAAEEYVEMKKNVLSESTIREYSGKIKRLSTNFTDLLLSDLTNTDVQKEINRLSASLSPKTVRDYNGFISAVLGTFKPGLVVKTTLPQKHKSNPYIPTDEDVQKLLAHARGSQFEVALILGCYGMRRSEICALTLDDIQGNIIHINKALVMDKNKKWVLKKTKTEDSTRSIWVPDEVIAIIKQHGKIYNGFPGSISNYMSRTQDALGIPHFSLHKLRHYFASMSHALGIPNNYIMDAGGWKTDTVLNSVYRHAMADKKDDMQHFAAEYLKEVILR